MLSTWHLAHSASAFVTNQLIWISLNQGANSTRCNSQCVFSPLPTSVQRHKEPLICFTNFPFLTFLEKLQGYFLIHPNITSIYGIGIRRFRPLSSSPLLYTVFAPTLFEFDPIKSSSPLDWVIRDEGTSRMFQMSSWENALHTSLCFKVTATRLEKMQTRIANHAFIALAPTHI